MKFRNTVISETMEGFLVDLNNQPLCLISDLTRLKIVSGRFSHPQSLKVLSFKRLFFILK